MNETPDYTAGPGQDAFEARLHAGLNAVQAPAGLQQRLLQIPDMAATAEMQAAPATATAIERAEAANEPQFLRRLLPAAAALLVAIGIGLYYQPDLNAELASEIFGHIYMEEPFYGEGEVLAMSEVNARLQPVTGDSLPVEGSGDGSLNGSLDASEALQVTFAKDCYIAKNRSMHLVVKGATGPVNVMMIPDQVVDSEVTISDQRFSGLVTPASGGTLVVVGNKQEPIREYRDLVAAQLKWEY
jgi:hypothetical protein